MLFEKLKLGLALGGGGARGLCHIGVLKALESAGIEISFLAGSSMGALVGGAYAVGRNAKEVEDRFMEFMAGPDFEASGLSWIRAAVKEKGGSFTQRIDTWFKRTYLQARFVSRPTLLDREAFMKVIDNFLPEIRIEDLPLPFWAMGTDLVTGRPVVFKTGSLRDAVYASTAIPGVVAPLLTDEYRVVDGGVVTMAPVLPAWHMGADLVIAVDAEKCIEIEAEYGSAMDVLFRVEDVQNYYLREIQLQSADLVITPKVGNIHWSEFDRTTEAIQLGLDETLSRIEEIKALAGRRRMPWRRKSLPPPPPRVWIEV